MDETKKLAEFCAALTFDDLPAPVVEKAKHCLLDFFANVYGSLQLDEVQRVVDYYRAQGGSATATVLGAGFSTGVQHAAFVNGVGGEALEAQDGLRFGGNHPGVAVIPAVLAAAEETGASGKQVLTAIVVGYEVAGRVAAAVHPAHTLSGFLPTGTCGAFGAAAAVASLQQADAELMLQSLGNAGYLAPLSMAEHLMGGYTAKILQGGQAASVGLTAAGLARAGITGAPYVLEGSQLNGGFLQITTKNNASPERVTVDLGKTFSIEDIYFKPYTACRHTHGSAQAALALRAEHDFAVADIAAIDVATYMIAAIAVGKGVAKNSSFVAAQFSIPYVAAACLLDGDMGPAQFRRERIADDRVLALAGKVTVQPDAALSEMYPAHTASRVEIKLADGKTMCRQIDTPKGDPRDPMTAADLTAKLARFATPEQKPKVRAIAEATLALEQTDDIRTLTTLL
ncbi:MAG TPA: MmgE/PrpD family protein [bacterium]|nr:MmgE/PrpD family protein [bacterium]